MEIIHITDVYIALGVDDNHVKNSGLVIICDKERNFVTWYDLSKSCNAPFNNGDLSGKQMKEYVPGLSSVCRSAWLRNHPDHNQDGNATNVTALDMLTLMQMRSKPQSSVEFNNCFTPVFDTTVSSVNVNVVDILTRYRSTIGFKKVVTCILFDKILDAAFMNDQMQKREFCTRVFSTSNIKHVVLQERDRILQRLILQDDVYGRLSPTWAVQVQHLVMAITKLGLVKRYLRPTCTTTIPVSRRRRSELELLLESAHAFMGDFSSNFRTRRMGGIRT